MLGIIGTLLGLIPGLTSLANNFLTRHFDAQVQMYMAKTGADRDTAVAAIRGQAEVQTRWWFVAIIPPLFAAPFIVYTWKVVLWDKVLGWGSTDPINGTVGWVYVTIVGFYFLHGITNTVIGGK